MFGEDVEKLEPLCVAGGNIKRYSCCAKVWQFLKTLNIELPYDPAILLLGIYPKELEAGLKIFVRECSQKDYS